MNRFAAFFLLPLVLPALAVEQPVPREFLGEWVPKDQSCQSPIRLRVEAGTISLVNRSDAKQFGGLDICHSCEGGVRYSGRVVWLFPEFKSGPSAFTVRFNANEQIGVTVIEMNEPNLRERFPLHNLKLRKCAGKT